MFGGTNPFGQSSSGSPFGSQPVFGQTGAASNNPFAPKPFGGTTPFGSPQTGSNLFGGTSTGMFGTPQASPFGAPQTGSNLFGGTSTGMFGTPQASPFGAPQTGSNLFGGTSTGMFGTPQASPFSASSFGSTPSAFGGMYAHCFSSEIVMRSWCEGCQKYRSPVVSTSPFLNGE